LSHGTVRVLYPSASVRRDVFAQTGIILSVGLNQPRENLSLPLEHSGNLDTVLVIGLHSTVENSLF